MASAIETVLIPIVPAQISWPSSAGLLFFSKSKIKILLFETNKRTKSVFPHLSGPFSSIGSKSKRSWGFFLRRRQRITPPQWDLNRNKSQGALAYLKSRRKSDCLFSGVMCVSIRKTLPSQKRTQLICVFLYINPSSDVCFGNIDSCDRQVATVVCA